VKHHYFRQNEVIYNLDNLESHAGSTIVSHIAYRMHMNGVVPTIAEQIWFKSMSYLKSGSSCRYRTFSGFREALIDAAEVVINQNYSNATTRKKMLVKVHSALNYAQIFRNSSFKIGDVNRDGAVDSRDAVLVSQYAANTASIWTSDPRTAEDISLGDVNYDGKISNSDSDKILQAYSTHTPLN
jgi:hypothetical protein